MIATVPAIGHAYEGFLARGAPGHGEAAPGDHLQTAYRLWLPGHQIEQLEAPWRDPYSFQPETEPQLNPAAWPFALPFWPLWRVFGMVIAWNLLLLLGLVGAGVATYLWLRELDIDVGAALVGGLVFELAPYRLAQSSEHLLGLVSVLLPLSLWALERSRRGSVWWILLSIAALTSIPISGELHFAGGAIVFFLVYAIARAPRERRPLGGAVAATAAAAGAGVALWLFATDGTLAEDEQPLRKVGTLSAHWLDFVRRSVDDVDTATFFGWLTPLVALAGLGLLVWWRRYGLAAVLGLAALVPAILALGTTTPVYEAVRFAVVPLRYVSAPGRLMPVACLAVAALVAFAVDELAFAKLPFAVPRQAIVVPFAAAVILVADLRVTVFEPTAADQGNAAYAALLTGRGGRVVELPVFGPDVGSGSAYLYYAAQGRRERPLGYSAVAPASADEIARTLAPLNCGDWRPESQALLDELGVSAIVFHPGLYRDNPAVPDTAAFAWRALVSHGYRPEAAEHGVTLFRRHRDGPAPEPPVEDPPTDAAVFCSGWAPNEGTGRTLAAGHGSVWAHSEDGTDIRLFMQSRERTLVDIAVDGRPALSPTLSELAEVRVPVGTAGWHLLSFDATPGAGVRLVAYGAG